jgi:hypothetical protein
MIKSTMMKIKLLAPLSFLLIGSVWAQTEKTNNTISVNQETGLTFSFDEGAYQFEMGGFFQPSYQFLLEEGHLGENYFNAKRSFFRIGGQAREEKLSFLIQTDFSEMRPLLDAWIGYHPTENLSIYMGQRQTFANNLEMRYREDRLQFVDRSQLSTALSRTGREFGLFVEGRFGNTFGVAPMVAITSGDGRNSFGVDARDSDLGGVKYAARLDLFPLGYFSKGNDLYSADLMHEAKPKVMIGAAYSLNEGASNFVGEGHGDFFLYNENGNQTLPNYRQIYLDFLAKYKGFSWLVEFANASANGLGSNRFLNENATQALMPGQISTLLALGNSYNTQIGYVTKSGYSFDVRYGKASPEFALIAGSALPEMNHFTVGFTKYFKGHNLKAQTAYTLMNFANGPNATLFEVMMQVAF